MNKKGFTLIEVIAVIVILGIISTVAIPIINKYLFKARDRAYDTYVETLYNGTRIFLEKNTMEIPGNKETKTFTSQILTNDGYIDPLQDPEDKRKECTGNVMVTNNTPVGTIRSNPDLTYKITLTCSRKTRTKTVN